MNVNIKDLDLSIKALVETAKAAMNQAYAPYSNYKVGCAVLDENGHIHKGCNVENAAYTGTHAEASAIANMRVNGGRQIIALACVTKNGGASCGDCRQRIWEFSNLNRKVLLYFFDTEGNGMTSTIGQLLPEAFELDQTK